MAQTVIQIGNSVGVTIPADIRKKIGLKKGSKVNVVLASDGKTMMLSKNGTVKEDSSITPEFKKWLDNVNERYGPVLKELAKK